MASVELESVLNLGETGPRYRAKKAAEGNDAPRSAQIFSGADQTGKPDLRQLRAAPLQNPRVLPAAIASAARNASS